MVGFHLEKAFTERAFQTNYNVCVKKVNYQSLMVVQYSLSLEFSGAVKQIINCVRSKQAPRRTPAK